MPNVPNLPGVPALTNFLTAPIPLVITDIALSFSQGLQSLQWGIYDQFGTPIIASATTPLFNLGPIGNVLNSVSGLLLGQQLINQVSVVDFEYKQDWNISTAPVENGGFQSYNKVQLPFDVRMRVAAGGDQANRTSLLTVVDNLANSGLAAGIPGLPSALNSIITAPTLLSGVVSTLASATGLGSILGISTSIPLFSVLTPEKIFNSCSVSHYDYKRTSVNGVGIIIIDIWLIEVRVTATSSFTNTQTPSAAGIQNLGNQQAGASTPLGSLSPQ